MTFPEGCPLSIFGAGELNFRVRDGNGVALARVTGIRCVWTCFGMRPAQLAQGEPARGADRWIFDFVLSRQGVYHDPQPLTPGQLLKKVKLLDR